MFSERLLLRGTLPGTPEPAEPIRHAFVLVSRQTKTERVFAASGVQRERDTLIEGNIPLAALDLPQDELVDVFYQGVTSSGTVRTRMAWAPNPVQWLPYSTKFGNLSLKRKQR
jgi:hypothetical protein